jgi:RNA polymerase sigma factor (sigma-70 family)
LSTSRDHKNQTIKKNSGSLLGFIRNRVSNLQDAEDILQEVWFRFSQLADPDEIENISAWLFTVARNKVKDWYRKRKQVPKDPEEDENSILELLSFEVKTPEEQLFQDLIWEEIMEALDELPVNQREVFVKSEMEGMKLKEIAEEAGINIKTIISRKHYAVKYLRKRLEQLYNEL